MINKKTGDPVIAELNQKLAIAMDVKHLTSEQLAIRAAQKISGQGGAIYKLIGRWIDDYIFNPTFTTRASQAALGKSVGATGLRKAVRLGTTEALIETKRNQ